jgi:hypothetical protein
MTDIADYDLLPEAKRVEVEKIRLALRTAFSDLSGVETEVSYLRESAMQHQIYELRATVLGQKNEWCRFKAPLTWWDAVKERWCPPWLKKRYPVKYREEIVEAIALLPTLDLKIPGHRTTIMLQTIPVARWYGSQP